MPIEEDRHVAWIELHDLEPDTIYYFRTGGVSKDGGSNTDSYVYSPVSTALIHF